MTEALPMDNRAFEADNPEATHNGGPVQTKATPLTPSHISYANGKTSDIPGMRVGVVDGDNGQPPPADQAAKSAPHRDALAYCKLITKYPKSAFCVTLFGHVLFVLISAGLLRSGYELIPFQLERLPLDIRDDVDYLRQLAWSHRDQDADLVSQSSFSNTKNASERSETGDVVFLYYKAKATGGNVFTKENLKRIEDVENKFFEETNFKNEFCMLQSDGNCTKITSILRFFDGTYGALFLDSNYDQIGTILNRAKNHATLKKRLQFFLGKDAVINANTTYSSITRSMLYFGVPLNGYINKTDKEDEQEKKYDLFLRRHFLPVADKLYEDQMGAMEFYYFSGTAFGSFIQAQVFEDMALAGGSLVFIIVFMIIQTGSFWVTGWSVFSIITGFLCTNLIYRVIIDYRYFGFFHVLAVFIILGIGADDIFIFLDTWKGTGHREYPSLAHRLSDCYRKAALAMLFTSITTAVAFIVSALSPFLGVSSFGVFAGLLVAVNYISVVVFLPTVIVVHHLYWEKCPCCPCFSPSNTSVTDVSQVDSSPATSAAPPGGVPDDEDVHKRKHPVVRFFRGPFYRFIIHPVARWVILSLFAVLFAVSIYFASQLRVNEEQIQFVPDDTNFGQVLTISRNSFAATDDDETAQIYITWGLKPQNLGVCHFSDPKCVGDTVWDDNFHMNSAAAQQALLDFCQKLKTLPPGELSRLRIKTGIFDNQPQVACFMDELNSFLTLESNSTHFPQGTNFTLPISQSSVQTLMDSNATVYNASLLPHTFNRYFEIVLSYWSLKDPTSSWKYSSFIGQAEEAYSVKTYYGPQNVPIMYGTKLKYASIVVNTTMQTFSVSYFDGLPVRDAWENLVTSEIKNMPAELRGGFQCTSGIWHWFKVQKSLVSSALIGMGIGISIALPILILATMNVVTGVLATLIICLITTSVIGVIPMAGWKLGVLESLNLVLVVGLAVDYVVHLAEGYSRSPHTDRKLRLHDALEEVGISVLSGATTTLGASLFLLFAKIIFFYQFGLFMFSTIGFSILYALCFFTTVLGIIGPENNFGSIKKLFASCSKKDE